MNRQALLNTFVFNANGKGQSRNAFGCMYCPPDHPGCAIGCQKEFKAFIERHPDLKECIDGSYSDFFEDSEGRQDMPLIDVLITDFPELEDDFEILDGTDINFLSAMQRLHDGYENWDRESKRLIRKQVFSFCQNFQLDIPESEYA
jgi:hypothetical protein